MPTVPFPTPPETVLLKLGGEALQPDRERGLGRQALQRVARQLVTLCSQGVRLGVVVGGGNWWRGRDVAFIDRVSADQMGMLATALNGLALRAALEREGQACLVQSAIPLAFCDPLDSRRAKQALSQGGVVIFVGGTGNPLVSTDTAAALRAVELGAEVLLKATTVDGVYDQDPRSHPEAVRYSQLSFNEVLEKRLEVMDLAAFDLCQQHRVPIVVFDFKGADNLHNVVKNPAVGTLIC